MKESYYLNESQTAAGKFHEIPQIYKKDTKRTDSSWRWERRLPSRPCCTACHYQVFPVTTYTNTRHKNTNTVIRVILKRKL